jgi:hypothetical protein
VENIAAKASKLLKMYIMYIHQQILLKKIGKEIIQVKSRKWMIVKINMYQQIILKRIRKENVHGKVK